MARAHTATAGALPTARRGCGKRAGGACLAHREPPLPLRSDRKVGTGGANRLGPPVEGWSGEVKARAPLQTTHLSARLAESRPT